MTANQINAAAQREQARHDVATEEETNRHNVAMEKIEDEKNRISALVADYNHQYQETTNRLTKEYNDWYMKYQSASTKQKLTLEAEGNRIKQEQVDIERDYRTKMTTISGFEADIKAQQASENARHNKEMEKYNSDYMTKEFAFREKDLQYRKDVQSDTVWQYGQSNLIDAYNAVAGASRNPVTLMTTSFAFGAQSLAGSNPSYHDIFSLLYGGYQNEQKETKSKEGSKERSITFNPFAISGGKQGRTFNIHEGEFRVETGGN